MSIVSGATPQALPLKERDPIGQDLFHLFSVVLGAAISFLPASYLLVLPIERSLGLSTAGLTSLWFFVGAVLLVEYWKAARFNWQHGMKFKGKWRYVYIAAATAYVFTLAALGR